VLSPAEIAWLDQEFVRLAVRWPGVVTQIVKRGLQRAADLTCDLAISHIVGVDIRLLLLLTHLAERWGKVTQDGVVVPIPVTNEMLGAMVGARPPSVSTALRKLAQDKRVLRRRDGTWLLDAHALSPGTAKPPPASAVSR
jgi:CRP-like cAMP-binding protein